MISVTGPTHTDEYRAAEALQQHILAAWPACATDPQQRITLVAAAKCYGADICDLDLLVFVDLLAAPRVIPNGTQPTTLASCCLVIEVKNHPCDHVRFVGNRVEVCYHQRWHDVSEQNYRQVFALKNYLSAQHVAAPYIMNFIWLRHVPERELPHGQHTIIGCDTTWDSILRRISQRTRSQGRSSRNRITAGGNITAAAQVFTTVRRPHATTTETQKLTSLRQATTSFPTATVPAYVTKLGSQLLIFQGRGGTGKTVSLLKLAHGLYVHRQARVLILTYNHTLVADMRRLLALLDVPDAVAKESIGVQTARSFFRHVLADLGVISQSCPDFLDRDRYADYLAQACTLLQNLAPDERTRRIPLSSAGWEHIFIDEAQDWSPLERDLLFLVYDARQFVLADGTDQLVWGQRLDWRATSAPVPSQIVSLRKSLRLKAGVCTFFPITT